MDNYYAETWRDENGFTIDDINDFIDSIAMNDIDEVREFLENGMDPNVVSYQGDKPLVVAAEDGLDEMVLLLLSFEADPFDTVVYNGLSDTYEDIVLRLRDFGYVNYDNIYDYIMNRRRSILMIQRMYRGFNTRNNIKKTLQSKQLLELAKGMEYPGSVISTNMRREPELMEKISQHLRKKGGKKKRRKTRKKQRKTKKKKNNR